MTAAATHGAYWYRAYPPNDRTSRISCVAYPLDDRASEANTGSAMRLGSSVSPSWFVCSARPNSTRLEASEKVPTWVNATHSADPHGPRVAFRSCTS